MRHGFVQRATPYPGVARFFYAMLNCALPSPSTVTSTFFVAPIKCAAVEAPAKTIIPFFKGKPYWSANRVAAARASKGLSRMASLVPCATIWWSKVWIMSKPLRPKGTSHQGPKANRQELQLSATTSSRENLKFS